MVCAALRLAGGMVTWFETASHTWRVRKILLLTAKTAFYGNGILQHLAAEILIWTDLTASSYNSDLLFQSRGCIY